MLQCFEPPGISQLVATARGRLRAIPVILTAITTILGLIPMVFEMTILLVERQILFGAPSSQWWTQLSSTIAGGLTFATILTLLATPAMLVLGSFVAMKLRGRTTAA